MGVILKIENISKQYRLGLVGTGSLAHDVNRFWHRIRGKEDPYLKIGAVNERNVKAIEDYVWALRDINFEVEKGEVLGIIGKNGAGKSTLLKILSRVTSPTTGSIKTKGRIASLLEVGTGFHPELTGVENIYLNGAILGMTKAEISRKIDEIVAFSGCELYIDTPVKRYSSGMRVRLAFAVAAHLEPDILVIDEVLAVGDAEFQRKAIGKMRDISKGEGRTVLFVSHNMASVKQLCTRGIVLENGFIVFEGNVNDCVDYYLNTNNKEGSNFYINESPRDGSDILEVKMLKNDKPSEIYEFDDTISIYIKLKQVALQSGMEITFRIKDIKERNIFSSTKCLETITEDELVTELLVLLPISLLVPNTYFVDVALHIPNIELIRNIASKIQFIIEETGSEFHRYAGLDYGAIIANCDWRNY
jgi:lipopolysaccharide transport system ATP-binding protein